METLPYFLGVFGVITTLYSAVNVFFAKRYRQYMAAEGPFWILIGISTSLCVWTFVFTR